VLKLKNKNGSNPFGVIEMLPDNQLPPKDVIEHAKEVYPQVKMPDTVRAWNKEIIFGYYSKKNEITILDEMIFSEGRKIRWEYE
jgi:hypothetical protein